MTMKNIYLSSLTSLAIMATVAAHAEQAVVVPTLEGGFTASVGTFFYAASSDSTGFKYGKKLDEQTNNNGDYNFGWQAALGYVFEDTANSIELSYRGLDSTDTESYAGLTVPKQKNTVDVKNALNYNLESGDLMLTQFVDFGDYVQMRFLGGLSYLFLERKNDFTGTDPVSGNSGTAYAKSKFSGFGPRVGLDTRYDFGGEGFGIVGGASLAYFLGTMKYNEGSESAPVLDKQDQNDNHNVTNLRANLGVDYVYFFDNEEKSTLGLELGYLVDYYADAVSYNENLAFGSSVSSANYASSSATFSGPYLNIKGAF